MTGTLRIDKWLWAVRLFKTRSMATEACRKGQVEINGLPVKASHEVRTGEVIRVRRAPIWRSYRVAGFPLSRVGAPETPRFMEEVTPSEELAMLEEHRRSRWIIREPGSGRPTKKERRDLDDFFSF